MGHDRCGRIVHDVKRHDANKPQPADGANPDGRPLGAIILAAGKGTRMESDLPKVAHRVAERAMVEWVVDAARSVGASPIVLIVGYGQDVIRALFQDAPDVQFVEQREQLGTAHAVACARDPFATFDGDVLVLCGDGPLIRPHTLETLIRRHTETKSLTTLATSTIADPTGYGRIVRDESGGFEAIVEHKNATPAQREIREINPSYYCFDARSLFETLERIEPNDVSGEYYITDVPGIQQREGNRVEVIDAVPPEDVLSINTLAQLREVDAILAGRHGTRMEARR